MMGENMSTPHGAIQPPAPPLELDRPWERAAAAFFKEGFSFGSLIPTSWFYGAMDIPHLGEGPDMAASEYSKCQLDFLTNFKRLEHYLIANHNMHLRNIRREGYEVVRPEIQTLWAIKEGERDLSKALQSMAVRLKNIETSALTDKEKADNNEALGRLAFFRRETRKALL